MTKPHGYKLKPNGKKDTGRPTVMTEEKIRELKDCFSKGYTDVQAYTSVGISEGAFKKYCREHQDFKHLKEVWKKRVDTIAKCNLVADIEKGNVESSKWWLERKCKDEFSKSPDAVINNNNQANTVYVTKKDEDDANEFIDSIIQD